MEPTISYLIYKWLLSNKRRHLIKFIFRCLLMKGRKKNEEKKNGRVDGSDDRSILEKQLIWQIKHLHCYGADCRTENAKIKTIKEPSYASNSCVTQYDIRKIRSVESQRQMSLIDENCTSLLDGNRIKIQVTRLCQNNATDFNKATHVMNLGPGDLFRSYLKKDLSISKNNLGTLKGRAG